MFEKRNVGWKKNILFSTTLIQEAVFLIDICQREFYSIAAFFLSKNEHRDQLARYLFLICPEDLK